MAAARFPASGARCWRRSTTSSDKRRMTDRCSCKFPQSAERRAGARDALPRSMRPDAPWVDGRVTAGHQGARVKHNQQIAETSAARARTRRRRARGARTASAVHQRCAAAARLSAAVQPLRGRTCSSAATSTAPCACCRGERREDPHRPVGDAVSLAAGNLRRRRTADRGHLRHALGQACRWRPGALSGDQPAPRRAGHARRARRVVLLGAEHGARRCATARCCSTWIGRSSG